MNVSFARMPEGTIGQWIAEARSGSRAALGQLLDNYRLYLLQVANQELADDLRGKVGGSDLVQQTFLEAQRDFAAFQGATEAEWLAWLRQVLHHNLTNLAQHYRETAKRDVGREVSLEADSATRQGVDGLPGNDPSPSGIVLAREKDAAIERAVARLPDEYRQVIVWRNRERLSYAEIGALLNRSAEAARKLWSRAVELLQKELGPET